MRTILLACCTAAAVLVAGGCASSAMVQPELRKAKANIRAAETVGADKHPQAALYLKRAHDNLKRARGLIEEDEFESAKRAVEQARVDAELSMVLAQAEKTRQAALHAQSEVEKLKERIR